MNSLNQFKDTNKVIGSCISKKVRQHNGEKTKKDLQNTTQKTKDLATHTNPTNF